MALVASALARVWVLLGLRTRAAIAGLPRSNRTHLVSLSPPMLSLGLLTLHASPLGTVVPINRKHPFEQHWSFDVQRELPDNWVIDVGYFANHGSRLITTRTVDTIPRAFLTTSNDNDNGTKATINLFPIILSPIRSWASVMRLSLQDLANAPAQRSRSVNC